MGNFLCCSDIDLGLALKTISDIEVVHTCLVLKTLTSLNEQ